MYLLRTPSLNNSLETFQISVCSYTTQKIAFCVRVSLFFLSVFFFWKCWVLGMINELSGNCSSFYNRKKPQHVLEKLILIHTILCKFTDYSGPVTHLKIFGVVIPKERFWGRTWAIFFWYDSDYRFVICSLHRLRFIVDVIPEEGLQGLNRQCSPVFSGGGKNMVKNWKTPSRKMFWTGFFRTGFFHLGRKKKWKKCLSFGRQKAEKTWKQ